MFPCRYSLPLAASLCSLFSILGSSQGKAADLPPDSEYVVINEKGQLSVNGQRQRYWAAIGKLYITAGLDPKDSPAVREEKIKASRHATDALLDRFEMLGFNSFRIWDAVRDENYQLGDGSRADCVDYFIFKAKQRGMRIWMAGTNRCGDATPQDVSIIDDPSSVEAWKAAFKPREAEKGVSAPAKAQEEKIPLRQSIARTWDPRLETLYIQRLKEIATHLNKHTGLRWSDDPVFAVWELTNEEWWMRKMVGGQWQKEPAFFKNQLIARWNAWLKTKYGSDEKLKASWKSLLAGESLEKGSVLLAPMAGKVSSAASMNDSNEEARASLQGLQQDYTLADFSRERASDVINFFMDLQLAHKNKVMAALKTWGKSCRLSPTIFDTGIGYEIQSQYLHQNADAVAHDAYVNGWGPVYQEPDLTTARDEQQKMLKKLDAERISANSGPWVNWLLKPPGISQGVPWLEHNRVEGKPFLCYETQIQQPAKYRADFPLRVAALASIQDWDWICWHYFAPGDDVGTNPKAFEKKMDVTSGKHPQGYHFTYDEVQGAMMRAAGFIFRDFSYKPAASPTQFIYGRKSLYAPESMVYGGSYGEKGMDMFATTYQYGVRIKIDPTKEDDEVIGPVVSYADRNTHNPFTPTEEIVFDWKKGFLSMDSPAAAAWTGMIAKVGGKVDFKNGVTLQDVSIINPEGIYSPIVPEENYLAFALYSNDGKSLSETKKASLSLVSTSFNSGFSLKENDFLTGFSIKAGGVNEGKLPVLTARVGATVKAPALNGMRYVLRDWNYQEIGKGTVENGELTISSGQPVFLVEFSR